MPTQIIWVKLLGRTVIALFLLFVTGASILAQMKYSSNPTERQKSGNLKLIILPKKDSFDSRENIKLIVINKNEGSGDLNLSLVCRECDYEVNVIDSRGNMVPLSPEGERLKNGNIFRRTYLILEPGKEMVEEIDLNKLFNITDVGEYRVSITRGYDVKDHLAEGSYRRVKATSNQAMISVFAEENALTTQMRVPDNTAQDQHLLKILIYPEKETFTLWEKMTDGSQNGISIRLGMDVTINAICRNDSTHELIIPLFDTEYDYDVTLVDSQGRSIQLSDQGKKIKSRRAVRHEYKILKPGEEIVDKFDLSQLFDLSPANEYQVVASLLFYTLKDYSTDADYRRGRTESNQISVRIQE